MDRDKMVPLKRAVNAAMTDTYSDIGVVQHRFSHWAARGLQQLIIEKLRLPIRRIMLPVNRNTMTATLPIDFDEEVFVGYVEKGVRIPIFINKDLVNDKSVVNVPFPEKCNECNESDISEDFNLSISSEYAFTHLGIIYEEAVKKKLYSDGSYWLIKNTPFLNITSGIVEIHESKEFISKLELTECGCIKSTPDNIDKIQKCCPEVYFCNFTSRSSSCNSKYGGYRIFEETGLIQLEPNFKKDFLYLEYRTFMPKINGDFLIPKVAFECLVSWIKFKEIENKPRVQNSDRVWRLNMYKMQKKNMSKVLGRVKLSYIIHKSTQIPKFDTSI